MKWMWIGVLALSLLMGQLSLGSTNDIAYRICIIRARDQTLYEVHGKRMSLADMGPLFRKIVVGGGGARDPVVVIPRGQVRVDDLIPLLLMLRDSGMQVARLCSASPTGDTVTAQTEVPINLRAVTNAAADQEFALPLDWYFESQTTDEHKLPSFPGEPAPERTKEEAKPVPGT